MRAARALNSHSNPKLAVTTAKSFGTGAWMGYTQPTIVHTGVVPPKALDATNTTGRGRRGHQNTATATAAAKKPRPATAAARLHHHHHGRPKTGVAALLSYCPAPAPSWAKERPSVQKEARAQRRREDARRLQEVAERQKRRVDAAQSQRHERVNEDAARRHNVELRRRLRAELVRQRRGAEGEDRHKNVAAIQAQQQQRRRIVAAEHAVRSERRALDQERQLGAAARRALSIAEQHAWAAQAHEARHEELAARKATRGQNVNQDRANKMSKNPHPASKMMTAQDRREAKLRALAAQLQGSGGGEDGRQPVSAEIARAEAEELLTLRVAVAAGRRRLAQEREQNEPQRATALVVNPDKVAAQAHRLERVAAAAEEALARRQRKAAHLKQQGAWTSEDEHKKQQHIADRASRRAQLALEARAAEADQARARQASLESKRSNRAAAVQDQRAAQQERQEAYDATRGQLRKHRAEVVAEEAAVQSARAADIEQRRLLAQAQRAQRRRTERAVQQAHAEGQQQDMHRRLSAKAHDFAFRKAHGKSHPILKTHKLFSQTASLATGLKGSSAGRPRARPASANNPHQRQAVQAKADVAAVRNLPDF
eukprot:INCI11844.1.p1 GENE.INCI11844.1~~INCI11844.1.p1  ORF type:complete len:600 (+),score=125.61 INCI11844.1:558-2357(+)